jgi:hypothetical protein
MRARARICPRIGKSVSTKCGSCCPAWRSSSWSAMTLAANHRGDLDTVVDAAESADLVYDLRTRSRPAAACRLVDRRPSPESLSNLWHASLPRSCRCSTITRSMRRSPRALRSPGRISGSHWSTRSCTVPLPCSGRCCSSKIAIFRSNRIQSPSRWRGRNQVSGAKSCCETCGCGLHCWRSSVVRSLPRNLRQKTSPAAAAEAKPESLPVDPAAADVLKKLDGKWNINLGREIRQRGRKPPSSLASRSPLPTAP